MKWTFSTNDQKCYHRTNQTRLQLRLGAKGEHEMRARKNEYIVALNTLSLDRALSQF